MLETCGKHVQWRVSVWKSLDQKDLMLVGI